ESGECCSCVSPPHLCAPPYSNQIPVPPPAISRMRVRPMHRRLLHNDEIRDTSAQDLSAGQVGLLNGWGVFSTIRVYDGVMFAWERHWARMHTDAARMRVPFPPGQDWLAQRLHLLIDANKAFNSTLRVA